MKAFQFFAMAAVALVACAATSCSDDSDDIATSKVPKVVIDSFAKKYPAAKSVKWEDKQPYYVADFKFNGFDSEAWFSAKGEWAMTESDYDTQLSMLPVKVSDAFRVSEYSTWKIDEVKYYEKPADSFCVIEVESAKSADISLFYDADGTLINTVKGDTYTITPTTNPAKL